MAKRALEIEPEGKPENPGFEADILAWLGPERVEAARRFHDGFVTVVSNPDGQKRVFKCH